jgi:glycosyltransferase involved in cell wall biosynthesis
VSDHAPLREVALACRWEPVRQRTWSGTPWMLRSALSQLVAVEDIDVSPPPALRTVFRAANLRRAHGTWKSLWPHSRAAVAWNERALSRGSRRSGSQAVISIQDLGRTALPLYIVQDLSYGLLLRTFGERSVPHFRSLPARRVRSLHDRQIGVWRDAAGLFPMSQWLADDMIGSGVPADKVVVVPPGVNVEIPLDAPVPERRRSGPLRLLFVGRDFDTKAGDQVVAAFRLLRARHGAGIELTVIGPAGWPLPDLPDGIDFRGPQPREEVDAAMTTHDLFVMPSRFEGFGIAFVEALARGLPCVGRDAFAMPEIIDRASGGRLVSTEDPTELADAVDSALADDQLYEACRTLAPERRRYYTWSRAARQMVDVVRARVDAGA